MSVIINGATPVYQSKQRILLAPYVDQLQSSQLQIQGTLAQNTFGKLYYTGSLLAQYGIDAPDPSLVGMWVNYDPASTIASQAICIGAISADFVNGITGTNPTNIDTATKTLNRVSIIKFSIGTTYLSNTLRDLDVNTQAQLTGFDATFIIKILAETHYANTPNQVETIQGYK